MDSWYLGFGGLLERLLSAGASAGPEYEDKDEDEDEDDEEEEEEEDEVKDLSFLGRPLPALFLKLVRCPRLNSN